jgi:hypothetical protein
MGIGGDLLIYKLSIKSGIVNREKIGIYSEFKFAWLSNTLD